MLDSFGGAFYRRQRMKVAERLINPKRDLIPQLLRFERSPLIASGLLRSDARTAIEEAAAMALRAYYDSISETEHLGDKLDRYHFEQVDVMRDSLAGNAQMNFIGLAHPFLSLPAIEAMTRLPIEERRRDAAHKFIVHESFPALERFALDNVGFTAPYRGFSTLRYGPMIVERGLRYVAKIFPKALHGVSLRRPTMDADMILRPGLKELREIVLSSHPQYDRFVNLEKVESAVREFEEHGSQASALVQLVSFRLFLDLFA
jgi:hypothetical protein